ncbi:polymorphic toxin type 15 domain-containing protein [Phyllobacterium sp. SB3]|uniref:polymorphic toxin type 15 domain-containing protein n=1 Tax=Phyllobacterium sp. SB3 TaxID=3156073 RepID=UPI0032AFC1EA
MEQADVNAEAETKATEAAIPCATCAKIKCFTPPKGSDEKKTKEFADQLKEQQDAINEIPPEKLVENLDNYANVGRGPGDARARQNIRDKFLEERTADLNAKNLSKGKKAKEALSAAEAEAAREASTLDAIHTPDLGAGGDGTFSSRNSGMGNRSVNRSIGSQWGKDSRLDALKEHANDAKRQGKKTNVKLEICPDKSGKKDGGAEPDSPVKVEPGVGDGSNGYGV